MRPPVRRIGLLAGAVATLTACTATSGPAPAATGGVVTTRTVTGTRTVAAPAPSFRPTPATSVAPLPPGAPPAAGERERACPYLASTPQQDPRRNVADIEGDHVYRTTVLTRDRPVGCRFYFYSGAFEAVAEIAPRRFATAKDAYNAMVLTARTGTDQQGVPAVVRGVPGVLYRTRFFGPDGRRDWACAVAVGRTMVSVRTQRTDTSLNALLIARAVAGKF